ncbi:cytochrome b5-like [Tachypleus tridentatus]|uniref:cytochrome b5-like n=1 Tax=Tachypleus tridentatus TaxID=6853 RepID=UPI003FD4BECD
MNTLKNTVQMVVQTVRRAKGTSLFEDVPSAPSQVTVFHLADVSQHCSLNDCWLIICDKVYDVTDFMRQHPGGEEIILEYAGRDATVAFIGTGHSLDTVQEMEKYCIGLLIEHERLNLYYV